ncbi:hypothetical protein BN1013_01590 [Candidatus Rubidus massiliensis]|nr:hypothetical protein BN1013_01590 [Candidatus Rubidus massiliensis]
MGQAFETYKLVWILVGMLLTNIFFSLLNIKIYQFIYKRNNKLSLCK